jgi:RNA polymerase sigma factor (sigma-70 family)
MAGGCLRRIAPIHALHSSFDNPLTAFLSVTLDQVYTPRYLRFLLLSSKKTQPTMDEPVPPALLQRVLQHEEAACRQLVELLYPGILRIVKKNCPQRMAEEDLCQEVFMSLFHSLHQYRAAVPFEHWVSRVALHTCYDHLRKQRIRPELRMADLTPEDEERVQNTLVQKQGLGSLPTATALELVNLVLAAMEPEQRLIIQWLELEERSVKDVAALMGWSVTLTKVRAFRARRRMRHLLDTLYPNERL